MGAELLGLGTARPAGSVRQDDAAAAAVECLRPPPKQARLLPALYRRAHVDARHSVLLDGPDTSGGFTRFYRPAHGAADRGPGTAARMERYRSEAPPLAAAAAQSAVTGASVEPSAITHLVTVSCTGFTAPGLDVALVDRLGLSPEVARTHVGFMGCHGAINGLRTAAAFAERPSARTLVCAVELCTLHFQYETHPDSVVTNALFADGAAAAILGDGHADGRPRLAATGSVVLPSSAGLMAWDISDHGFLMRISPRVPEVLREHLRPWLARWLASLGRSIDAIEGWAIHPGGPRLLDCVGEGLGLSDEATRSSREVLRACGNMSSPTVLFVLERLLAGGRRGPVVLLAFGPGLTVEAALVEVA